MDIRQVAQALGRRGGLARAKALSPERRRRIASMGGLTRSVSRHAACRIEANFKALEAVHALRRAGRSLGY